MWPADQALARGLSQRGSAALPMGVLLLFIAALILIAVSRTTLMEQRMSGNEIRTRQALQAAQAGVDQALAYMRAGGIDQGPSQGGDGQADSLGSLSTTLSPLCRVLILMYYSGLLLAPL